MQSKKRNDRPYYLTLEDRRQIERMCKEAYSYRQMEKVIKRSHASISREIESNGGRNNYNAEKADELWNSKRTDIKKNIPLSHERIEECEHKIKVLEMQIQIIFEQIKVIMNAKSK